MRLVRGVMWSDVPFWTVCFISTTYLLVISPVLALGQTSSRPPAEAKSSDRLETAGLQIALDDEGFSPGAIDGWIGRKTTLAIQFAHEAERDIKPSGQPWQTWKIPVGFLEDIAPVPESWLARSKLDRLGYETIREKLAERFHVAEEFLCFLNPNIKDWSRLQEGNFIQAPVLSPRRLPRTDQIRISLSQKVIVAYDAEKRPLASFSCSIAAKKEKRPAGQLEVRVLAPDPDYLFDPVLFVEVPEAATIKSKLMISPGPNNPVGEMWIGLNLKGYGIHGTPSPEDIGKTESHGCFRLTNWDAKRLAAMVRIGTPVIVEE